MHRRISAAGAALFIAAASGGTGKAGDRPLVWEPVKNSDTSYSVKLGMKLPVELEPQAGVKLGVETNGAGYVVNTPASVWSSIKTEDVKRGGYQMRRDVGVTLDAVGSAAITMNAYEKQIATPSLNMEREGAYALHYDGVQSTWTGVDVSQALKLRQPSTGTAFIASANSTNSFDSINATVGMEQKLGDNITLTGHVGRSFSDASNVASVNANYSYSW